jgi:hypothetical protein
MSDFIKATKVANTALGLLLRELTLPQLVWRDAGGDFRGAKDDTISLRLPAYLPARTRQLRKGEKRTKDTLHERKVDLTLDTDVYKDVGITDEELTLDITNFGSQVLNPVMVGIVLQLEQELIDTIEGATYANEIVFKPAEAEADAYAEVAVKARELLNNARVPAMGRALVVGSEMESAFLTSDKFVRADQSGSTDTLREAKIGRVAGFDVFTSPALASDKAYAFHKTAYAMATMAPIVPDGAPWGASQSFQGFAIRTVRVFDPDLVEDRFVADAWIGSTAVTDEGHYDADPEKGGKFEPVLDPDNPAEDESVGEVEPWTADEARLVRAVEITVE